MLAINCFCLSFCLSLSLIACIVTNFNCFLSLILLQFFFFLVFCFNSVWLLISRLYSIYNNNKYVCGWLMVVARTQVGKTIIKTGLKPVGHSLFRFFFHRQHGLQKKKKKKGCCCYFFFFSSFCLYSIRFFHYLLFFFFFLVLLLQLLVFLVLLLLKFLRNVCSFC